MTPRGPCGYIVNSLEFGVGIPYTWALKSRYMGTRFEPKVCTIYLHGPFGTGTFFATSYSRAKCSHSPGCFQLPKLKQKYALSLRPTP